MFAGNIRVEEDLIDQRFTRPRKGSPVLLPLARYAKNDEPRNIWRHISRNAGRNDGDDPPRVIFLEQILKLGFIHH
jgi:hypothetical protein